MWIRTQKKGHLEAVHRDRPTHFLRVGQTSGGTSLLLTDLNLLPVRSRSAPAGSPASSASAALQRNCFVIPLFAGISLVCLCV